MSSLDKWKAKYCNYCPVRTQCHQTNLEILNCSLSKLADLNKENGAKRGMTQ